MLFNPPRPDPGKKKKRKLTSFFIYTLLCVASKGLVKALKAFIKPFEAPQGKNETKLIFILTQLSKMHGAGRVKKIIT